MVLAEGEEIGVRELGLAAPAASVSGGRSSTAGEAGVDTMELNIDQLEKRHIERVLASEKGSVAKAARRLGIGRNTLYQKIKKYGIERPGF